MTSSNVRAEKIKVQEKANKDDKKEKKPSEFLCKIKYYNNLPDVPFEPKLLNYPFDPQRFVKYQTTTLEKNYKFTLHTEPDMGIFIDLIDPNTYKPPTTSKCSHFQVNILLQQRLFLWKISTLCILQLRTVWQKNLLVLVHQQFVQQCHG